MKVESGKWMMIVGRSGRSRLPFPELHNPKSLSAFFADIITKYQGIILVDNDVVTSNGKKILRIKSISSGSVQKG